MTIDVDDELWSAIGDPTRRRMVDLLVESSAHTSTTLSHHLPVSRQAIAKHLAVLDRAGLVTATTRGRERVYNVDGDRLATAIALLAEVGDTWDRRLQRIKSIAEQIERTPQTE